MKRAFSISLVLLLTSLAARAQVNINIIPKAGVSINNMVMKGSGSFYPTAPGVRLNGGVGLGVLLSEEMSIQPEINLVQKGYSINAVTANGEYRQREVYNQLEIPLLAKYTFSDYNSGINGFVLAGPFIGHYLNGSYERTMGTASTEGNIYFRAKPDGYVGTDRYMYGNRVSRTELGFQLGGGASIEAGPGLIMLDARYGFGVTNMYRKPTASDGSQSTGYGKTRGLSLSVGYAIPMFTPKQASVQIKNPNKPPRKPKKYQR